MTRDKSQQLVFQFDPDTLRAAIRGHEQRAKELAGEVERLAGQAEALRAVLRAYGHEDQEPGPTPPSTRPRSRTAARRFKDSTIADAAVAVLNQEGKPVNGRKILKALEAGGRSVGGKNPMSVLATLMRRDRRIAKDPSEPNLWRLRNGNMN